MSVSSRDVHSVSYDFEIAEDDLKLVQHDLAKVFGAYRYCYNETLALCSDLYGIEGRIPSVAKCENDVLASIYEDGWGEDPRDDFSVHNAVTRARDAYYRYAKEGAALPYMFSKHCEYQSARLLGSYDPRRGEILILDGTVALPVTGTDPEARGRGLLKLQAYRDGSGLFRSASANIKFWFPTDEVIGRFDGLRLFDESLPAIDEELYGKLVEARSLYVYERSHCGQWWKSASRYASVLSRAASLFSSSERAA